jgi:hypothetical protein
MRRLATLDEAMANGPHPKCQGCKRGAYYNGKRYPAYCARAYKRRSIVRWLCVRCLK